MSIQGIDVSNWQPSDFHLLPQAGYDFAICKGTEGGPDASGAIYVDPSFSAKWAAIKAAGLLRGVYHFARPDLGNTAAAEAHAFLTKIGPLLEPHDVVAFDLEKGTGDLAAYTQTFLDDVAAGIGFNPMLYSYPAFLAQHNLEGKPGLGKYGLWLADPNVTTPAQLPSIPGWAFIAIWQSGTAQVPGFPGAVDHDVFFGSRDQLIKYGKPVPPAPPPPPDPCADVKAQLAAAQGQVTSLTHMISQQGAKLQAVRAAMDATYP